MFIVYEFNSVIYIMYSRVCRFFFYYNMIQYYETDAVNQLTKIRKN